MAATSKQYELLFQLRAALGSNFTASFNSATKIMKEMQTNTQKINQTVNDINAYKKQQSAVEKSREKVSDLQAIHEKLQSELLETKKPIDDLKSSIQKQTAEINSNKDKLAELKKQQDETKLKIAETGKATKEQRVELKQSEIQIKNTTDAIKQQEAGLKNTENQLNKTEKAVDDKNNSLKQNQQQLSRARQSAADEDEKLKELSGTLKQAGVNTNNLDKETGELKKEYDNLIKTQEKLNELSEKQATNKQAISNTKSELLKVGGTIAAIGTAIYAGPVKSAMEFESSMAEVAKVVNWLKDDTGATTKEYTELRKEILGITTQIPMTAKEISAIMAAAGQAGVATDNKGLVQFATAAAKMGIAFDTTADQAGTWMANWRKSFRMSQEDVETLSDKINYLGNTSGANAQLISSVVTKIGPLGDVAGVASGEIAALGATLISTGIQEDVAATGVKNLMLAMVQGDSVTKRQAAVLDKLGINGKKLAERMQTDATGAIMDFLNAVKKLPEAEQAATLKDYFGKESVAAIAPLLTSMGELEENLNRVGDASKYAGSMEMEYQTKAETTDNKVKLAKNSLNNLSIAIGDTFLPYVGQAADKLTVLTLKFADFASKHPKLIENIAKLTLGLLGMKAGFLVAKLGFLNLRGGILGVKKVVTLLKAQQTATMLGSIGTKLMAIGKIALPIAGIAALAGGIIYVAKNTEKVRGFIKKTFGEDALAVFDKLWGILTEVGTALKSAFMAQGTGILDTLKEMLPSIVDLLKNGLTSILPVIIQIVQQLTPILLQLVTAVIPVLGQLLQAVIQIIGTLIADLLPVILSLIQAILPLIFQVIQAVLPVMVQLLTTLVPIFANIIQAILPVIIQLIQTLLPIIMQIIEVVLPVFINLLNTLVPIFSTIITAILPVLSALLQALIPIIQLVAEIFASVLGTALQTVSKIITNVMGILQGLIDFITGVFTGNWSQAWEGVKAIFSNVFGALKEVAKAPINFIISGINALIKGLNKLKIPDWVPAIGGKGINIPEIPAFAKGTNRTPDTFIAGEKGAELVTNAANRKVFTAAQTGKIFNNLSKSNDLNTVQGVNASMGASGTIVLHVTNSPTVVVNGDNAKDMKEQLSQLNEEFLEKLREIIKQLLKEQKEQEVRVTYA